MLEYRHPESLAEYAAEVRRSGYRCLVVLHSRDLARLVESTAAVLEGSCLLVAPSSIPRPRGCRVGSPGGFERLLGSEADYVIVASDGLLRPNLIAGLAGIVRGGGLLVLAVPPLERWEPGLGRGRYRRYLLSSLGEARCILWADADTSEIYLLREPPRQPAKTTGRGGYEPRVAPRRLVAAAATPSQARALDAFAALLRGRGRSFLVVGDRGRGKSYLLGLAVALAAYWGYAGSVPVVAPSASSLASFFHGLTRGLRLLGAKHTVKRDASGDIVAVTGPWGRVAYSAPDEAKPSGMIVFDEAAAVGVARIRRLSWKSGRVLAATTIHGYEGSGRVFQHMVEDILPKPLETVELVEPIRYPPGDPLEEWTNTVFALKPGELPAPSGSPESCRVASADPDELAENPRLLRELMQLLALAHYRTEPDYILTILESDRHRVHMLDCGGLVAAADTAVEEWGPAVEEAARISLKMLWLQTFEEPRVRAVRIVRIAVYPRLQRRGLGSTLLQSVERWASEAVGADLVTAMFGRHDVIGFWARNGYKLYYISPRYNKATGEKNLAFAKPLTRRGGEILAKASSRMRLKMLLAAHTVYRDVAAEKLATLLALAEPTTPPCLPLDEKSLSAYLSGTVEHEQVFDTIYALAVSRLAAGCDKLLEPREAVLLIAHVLQGKPLGEAAEIAGLTVEQAAARLREAVKRLYSECTVGACEEAPPRYPGAER